MPATPTARRYTVEEVYGFPADGNRYEVVHGELLVTPAPRTRHQAVVGELYHHLRGYLEPLGLAGTIFLGPADYFYGEDVYVQPDLLVARPDEVSEDWRTMRRLRLVVEVLSPSSERGDRLIKRRAYQEAGVGTYWVVDADRGVVEVWHPGDEVAELVTGTLTWQLVPDAPPLRIDLRAVFGALPGARGGA